MIRHLNTVAKTKQKYVSVSRPRRFGKTMAADMICAYYDREAGSREMFAKLKVARRASDDGRPWDEYLGQFDVVRIVMTDFMEGVDSVQSMLSYLTDELVDELRETYPSVRLGSRITLRTVMSKVYGATQRQFVIVIDEWDAIFRTWKENAEGQTRYLDFLRDWLKDKPYVALAYMTGILPIKKYGEHSALNMFSEYSMMAPRQLASYTGFTEDEVRGLCVKYHMDYRDISSRYDGYLVSDWIPTNEREAYRSGVYQGHRMSIYSPLSVVESMLNGRIQNYWNKTETYEALAEYIRRDYDGLKEAVALLMDGGRLRVDTSTYQNDMTTFHGRDDVLSLLIHLGYLGFDDETCEVFIPNREILDEFRASTRTREWTEPLQAYERSMNLLKATWDKDANRVAELLEEAHDRAANRTYHDEAALSYAVQLAYYAAAQKHYTTILELDSGKGYADIAYLPSPRHPEVPALVVELKYNKSAETAIAEIQRQKYPARLDHYRGKILLVGIDYDRDVSSTRACFKHHRCKIEEA